MGVTLTKGLKLKITYTHVKAKANEYSVHNDNILQFTCNMDVGSSLISHSLTSSEESVR